MAILTWQLATVTALHEETPRVRTITLLLPEWPRHRPGQHVDIRLTAADGYQAERSYSIASAPSDRPMLDLTVERVSDGEVSPFLHDELRVGDRFELRGPIGGYFVWDAAAAEPVLLIAGGSGIVPLMAMIRHRARASSAAPFTLLYSSRAPEDVIYASELEQLAARGDGVRVVHTFTRGQPQGWTGYARRIDRPMIGELLEATGRMVQAFVCGPTPLVEVAAESLVGLGLAPAQVRTERFGPSGS
jgi:ferredoxin-NADP reductase